MPDSTSALISQLSNPPNPLTQFGGTLDFANKLKDFQANQAASDAYRQSIRPDGSFDQGLFNSLTSQAPGGSWQFGKRMLESGEGFRAQGAGTQQDIQAKQQQLQAAGEMMYPLYQRALVGAVPASEVQAAFDQAHDMGLINDQQYQRTTQTLGQIGPNGDARGIVLGANMGNQAAQRLAVGQPGYANQGGSLVPYNLAPGSVAPQGGTIPMGLTPGQWSQEVEVPDPKTGLTVKKRLGDVLGVPPPAGVGGAGGSAGAGAPGPQSSAAPAGAFDTGDPELNLIAKYESRYKPMAGWGGAKDVDLSGYPLTPTGFPDWKGNPGPQGNSTAAGLFQITKSTWNSVAPQLIAEGKMKPDFSVESQIAVAKALKEKNGLSDWLPYNPQLAAAYARGEKVQFPQKPMQVASAQPTTATDAQPDTAGRPGGYGPGTSGVYIPPGGSQPLDIQTGRPVNPATGMPAAPGPGVTPQPPGPGQPTNINQPTPPVTAVPAPVPPVQVAQASGAPGTSRDIPTLSPFVQPQLAVGAKDYTESLETDKTLGVRTKPLINAIQLLRNNPTTPVGPAAKDWTAWQTALHDVFGIDVSTQGATTYQELAKQLAQNAVVQSVASSTDLARLNSAAAQPNPEQSREAIETLAAEQIGMERIKSAQYRYFRSLHPGKYPAANSPEQNAQYFNMETGDWAADQDPMAYGLDFAPQKAINDYLKGLDNNSTTKFGNSVNSAKTLLKMRMPTGAQ